jgi:hypothetical protein
VPLSKSSQNGNECAGNVGVGVGDTVAVEVLVIVGVLVMVGIVVGVEVNHVPVGDGVGVVKHGIVMARL